MSIKENGHCFILSILLVALSHIATYAQGQDQKSGPGDLVNALHSAFGEHHSRAVHAKGIILEGSFIPDKAAAQVTKAVHLQNQPSKVLIRFSDFTGIPNIPDNNPAANPRGLGIKFILPDGTTTDIISHSFNGLPTATSDEFRELLLAIGASGNNAAKPSGVDKFLATHPIAKTFLSTQHIPASFATINYYGVNSFKFTNDRAVSRYIRYQFIAETGEKLISPEQSAQESEDYLFAEIKKRIADGPIRFKLYAQIAEAGDKIDDPSIAWPDTRNRIYLGEVTLTRLADNSIQQDKGFVINPGNIPDGIEMADPMLILRSKAYPISVKERQDGVSNNTSAKPASPPDNFKHQNAKVNGINIHYVIGGEGEPLVLIHGFGQNWYMWNRLLPELSKHFTVIAPDLPGVGESDKPTGGYDKKALAANIHELLNTLGYHRINLVGHDIGLMVAYAYAAQYGDEVKKVAFLDALLPGIEPVWSNLKEKLWWFGFFGWPGSGKVVEGKEREFLSNFWPVVGHNNNAFTKEETEEFIRAYSVKGATTGSFHWFAAFDQDAKDNLKFMKNKLTMPVLTMGGEYQSASFLGAHIKKVAINVKEVNIKNAGHWLVQEQTQPVQDGLMDFFMSK